MDKDKDKGKSVVDPSSQGIWVSATELYPSDESDSDAAAAARASRRAPGVFEGGGDPGASCSTASAHAGDPGASSSTAGSHVVAQDITPFEDGQYVRLRNRGRGGYLFASESGRGVTVSLRRRMVNTAWAVQILSASGGRRVLLRGAYGRYLAATRMLAEARSGLLGHHAMQCNFEHRDDHDIEWSVARGKKGSVVLLHVAGVRSRALRANGRYQRWNTGVTLEPYGVNQVSSMMEWEVRVIPQRVERPPYQRRPLALIRWGEDFKAEVEVSFAYACFGHNGRVEYQGWMDMRFDGRSLTALGNEIARRLGNGVQFENMTLCVQAGNFGRPTPLLTDLPLRDDPVNILVFMVNSPGDNLL
ncbi:hypothetical protein HU200_048196 [Digitaria exilis]|uniref:DUF569 domain-containing protein n=1 Tax=Digitaria exilis TaxID=1010633 RepID=A0A835AVG2_9POAL|nr:hypothetical protein HU200_048196 [Digitaria exilis]